MNFGELKTAILSDSHRSDYTAHVSRFVAQGEALIGLSLDGYFLETTIDEDDRVLDAVYTLPAKVTTMRHVIYDNRPLDQADENLIGLYRSLGEVALYCMRGSTVVFAGIPPENAEFNLNYYGMPVALSNDSDTNNLLNDCPQLYIEAAQVYLYKRARNTQLAESAMTSVQFMIREINRRTKKKLGGAQSSNPYNVSFRSSY